MKTKIRKSLLLALFISFQLPVFSQSTISADSIRSREYQVSYFNQLDLRNSSYNSIAVHRLMLDAFKFGIKPHVSEEFGAIGYGVYSFGITYLTMIWSHEFGHSLRAKQVGGHFNIHNAKLPIPFTTMELPDDISLPNEALSVTGGFEVNYLTVRHMQREFIEHNGSYNEDLSYGFANRLMYPIYTTLIVPVNPEDRDIWINTAGDPIHCILPVFKEYSNGQVFMADSSVNPELVKFYTQSAILGTYFNLLDPQFYREVAAAFGKQSKDRKPVFLLGDHSTGWTYGTLFTVSPLGYELYMNNYIHHEGKQFSLYLKYGRPFKNNGVGLRWANIVDSDVVQMSALMEFWDQDIFGRGVSSEIQTDIKINTLFSLNLTVGYKSQGFILGKQIDAGANLGFGLTYHAHHKTP